MPFEGNYSLESYQANCERKKKKLKYWMDKGCSKSKAETLLYRYGY